LFCWGVEKKELKRHDKKKSAITILFYFQTVHPLQEVDLDLKENDFIVLPPNLKRSVRRLRKNRQKKLGEDQHSNIRKKGNHSYVQYL